MKISGEPREVRGETVDSLKEKLPELFRGNSKKDVWNLDESLLFEELYQIMSLPREVHSAKVVERPKSV